jgi:hypothetical protein
MAAEKFGATILAITGSSAITSPSTPLTEIGGGARYPYG